MNEMHSLTFNHIAVNSKDSHCGTEHHKDQQHPTTGHPHDTDKPHDDTRPSRAERKTNHRPAEEDMSRSGD